MYRPLHIKCSILRAHLYILLEEIRTDFHPSPLFSGANKTQILVSESQLRVTHSHKHSLTKGRSNKLDKEELTIKILNVNWMKFYLFNAL